MTVVKNCNLGPLKIDCSFENRLPATRCGDIRMPFQRYSDLNIGEQNDAPTVEQRDENTRQASMSEFSQISHGMNITNLDFYLKYTHQAPIGGLLFTQTQELVAGKLPLV
jgi:hypothetical protein